MEFGVRNKFVCTHLLSFIKVYNYSRYWYVMKLTEVRYHLLNCGRIASPALRREIIGENGITSKPP